MLRPAPAPTSVVALLLSISIVVSCNFDSGIAYSSQEPPEGEAAPTFQIKVLEGENGANILETKTAVKLVVEVRSADNLPAAGVTVGFFAPESGPRVTFANGSRFYLTTTDEQGRATVHEEKPLGKGPFQIKVEAGFEQHWSTASVLQTNYLTAAAAAGGGSTAAGGKVAAKGHSHTMIGVIAAGAAAAGVGAALAGSKGGSKSTSTPTGTIGSPGTPVISHP